MSCLPFAAWAAKKAAQIVGDAGGSSGGGSLREIHLTTTIPAPGEDSVTLNETDSNQLYLLTENWVLDPLRFSFSIPGMGTAMVIGTPVILAGGNNGIQYICNIGPFVVTFSGTVNSQTPWDAATFMLSMS